uniref:Uncharacterized protein n=1 Tax=Cacopsylla melanoneura TaxID=428564 RepID=A0A8D8R9W7_9HEMI
MGTMLDSIMVSTARNLQTLRPHVGWNMGRGHFSVGARPTMSRLVWTPLSNGSSRTDTTFGCRVRMWARILKTLAARAPPLCRLRVIFCATNRTLVFLNRTTRALRNGSRTTNVFPPSSLTPGGRRYEMQWTRKKRMGSVKEKWRRSCIRMRKSWKCWRMCG